MLKVNLKSAKKNNCSLFIHNFPNFVNEKITFMIRNNTIFLLLLLSVLRVSAQTVIDSVRLKAYYQTEARTMQEFKPSHGEKVLEIGYHSSKFYSYYNERRTAINDSMTVLGASLAQIMSEIDRQLTGFKDNDEYKVFKNFPKKGTLTGTHQVASDFKYTEPMEQPEWQLQRGDTLILDYPCKKASTTFRGRTWNVWYTPDIPVQEGPWKLYGLPGLILYAADADSYYTFKCMGLENGNDQPMVSRISNRVVSVTRKKLMELIRLSAKDPLEFIRMTMGPAPKPVGPDGRPRVYPERTAITLENDY